MDSKETPDDSPPEYDDEALLFESTWNPDLFASTHPPLEPQQLHSPKGPPMTTFGTSGKYNTGLLQQPIKHLDEQQQVIIRNGGSQYTKKPVQLS